MERNLDPPESRLDEHVENCGYCQRFEEMSPCADCDDAGELHAPNGCCVADCDCKVYRAYTDPEIDALQDAHCRQVEDAAYDDAQDRKYEEWRDGTL